MTLDAKWNSLGIVHSLPRSLLLLLEDDEFTWSATSDRYNNDDAAHCELSNAILTNCFCGRGVVSDLKELSIFFGTGSISSYATLPSFLALLCLLLLQCSSLPRPSYEPRQSSAYSNTTPTTSLSFFSVEPPLTLLTNDWNFWWQASPVITTQW